MNDNYSVFMCCALSLLPFALAAHILAMILYRIVEGHWLGEERE